MNVQKKKKYNYTENIYFITYLLTTYKDASWNGYL